MGRKKKRKISQKRRVVQINVSMLPDEKIKLTEEAKRSGVSLSNFIRLSIGLPPFVSRGNPSKKAL